MEVELVFMAEILHYFQVLEMLGLDPRVYLVASGEEVEALTQEHKALGHLHWVVLIEFVWKEFDDF